MSITRRNIIAGAATLTAASVWPARAQQDWPSRPLRIMVGTSPGGSPDIIITGTPSGVGFARKPPVFMKGGDTCEIHIEGVGVLVNPIADEK